MLVARLKWKTSILLYSREHFSKTILHCGNFAASWFNICHVPAGMHEVDWHNPPQRLLVLWLTGEVEFETSDGNIRRLPAGSVVLAEDTTGKGHISRHPPGGQLVVHVAFAEHQG